MNGSAGNPAITASGSVNRRSVKLSIRVELGQFHPASVAIIPIQLDIMSLIGIQPNALINH